ncbi:hypothetical protein AK812_SmicGene28541 [Symbiodinium microadriaticum]|uniref:Uncharacterized protein n=1 Tax=Symbiodinium microadriaticum TaxID=2951 RepID=A0A1Q9D436_SYMMI|nr:hypothetical protein AK812_SmicGene28541 [Symbiodinium microadriaticum]
MLKAVRLPDKKCYVIAGGKLLEGVIAVWRYPCQSPSDMEVWTAIALPDDFGPIPNDSIIISRHGNANTLMAGSEDGLQPPKAELLHL